MLHNVKHTCDPLRKNPPHPANTDFPLHPKTVFNCVVKSLCFRDLSTNCIFYNGVIACAYSVAYDCILIFGASKNLNL